MIINEEIVEKIKEKNLDFHLSLMILFSVAIRYNGELYHNNKELVKELVSLGFIKMNGTTGRFEQITPLFKDNKEVIQYGPIKQSKTEIKNFVQLEVIQWIDEWLSLFPKALYKTIGYDVHGNKTECLKRMITFRTEHYLHYTKDIIINATKTYLKERQRESYSFTKKNSKFIYDKDGSILENYCDRIVTEGFKDEEEVKGRIKHF